MAFFAELNAQNKVLRVMVVGDEHVSFPKDPAAEQWCLDNFQPDPNIPLENGIYPGVKWKQTFQNGIRGAYAGKGWTYLEAEDKFVAPKPFPSWILDNNFGWQPPIAYPVIDDLGNALPRNAFYPDNLFIDWNEDLMTWVGSRKQGASVIYKKWNSTNKNWEDK